MKKEWEALLESWTEQLMWHLNVMSVMADNRKALTPVQYQSLIKINKSALKRIRFNIEKVKKELGKLK